MLNLLEEERAILQVQLSQEEDAQSCFIQSALCLVQVNYDCRQVTRVHHSNLLRGLLSDRCLKSTCAAGARRGAAEAAEGKHRR